MIYPLLSGMKDTGLASVLFYRVFFAWVAPSVLNGMAERRSFQTSEEVTRARLRARGKHVFIDNKTL